MQPDEQLVQLYRKGDEGAFEELFSRYRRPVFGFVLRMLGNRPTAEDVFQEVFARVHARIREYESKEKFSAWLYTIAYHLCVDARRKQKRQWWLRFGDEAPEPRSTMDPEDEAASREMKELVAAQVEHLDRRLKEVFLLRIHGNLLFREIAQLLDVPLNTVLVRYHQAVLALREALKEGVR